MMIGLNKTYVNRRQEVMTDKKYPLCRTCHTPINRSIRFPRGGCLSCGKSLRYHDSSTNRMISTRLKHPNPNTIHITALHEPVFPMMKFLNRGPQYGEARK